MSDSPHIVAPDATHEGTPMDHQLKLTGHERFFEPDEIIVSKTDTKGRITYANLVFQAVSGFTEAELLGRAHNIIRHPDMPRCVFRFLWDTIGSGNEIFAYVINRCKNGDHYWVLAHVTPTFDRNGRIIGYHSSRRFPARDAIDAIAPLYKSLIDIERRHHTPREQWEASLPVLVRKLEEIGMSYDQFMFSLSA
jgi:PAS domain S-box-containing protein